MTWSLYWPYQFWLLSMTWIFQRYPLREQDAWNTQQTLCPALLIAEHPQSWDWEKKTLTASARFHIDLLTSTARSITGALVPKLRFRLPWRLIISCLFSKLCVGFCFISLSDRLWRQQVALYSYIPCFGKLIRTQISAAIPLTSPRMFRGHIYKCKISFFILHCWP